MGVGRHRIRGQSSPGRLRRTRGQPMNQFAGLRNFWVIWSGQLVSVIGSRLAVFGPLLAGALVSTVGLYGVLTVDAASFLVATVGLVLSRIPRPSRVASEVQASVLKDAAAGWHYIYRRPGLMGLLVLDGFKGF